MRWIIYILLFQFSTTIFAAQKYIEADMKIASEYQSNKLVRQDKTEDTSIIAALDFNVTQDHRFSSLKLSQGIEAISNSVLNEYDTTKLHSNITMSKHERNWSSSIGIHLKRDNTLALDANLFGFDLEKKWRNTYIFSSNLNFALNDRSDVLISAQWQSIKYENMSTNSIYDYSYIIIDNRVNFKISKSSVFSTNLNFSVLNSPVLGNQTENVSVNLVFDTKLSNNLTSKLSAGFRDSRIKNAINESSEIVGQVWFSINYEKERLLTTLSVERGLEPNGSGSLLQNDEVSASMKININRRLYFRSTFRFERYTYLQDTDLGTDSTAIYNTLSFTKFITRKANLSLFVKRNVYDISGRSSDISNEIVGMSLKYKISDY